MSDPATRNLRLLFPHAASIEFLAWMPIFFLFFEERIGFSGALLLEAIYYLVVVCLEVPSGYASDRLGRRGALLVSSFAMIASHVLFFFARDFAMLVVAQALLATGLAFCSGTDASLHYESLAATDRLDEQRARESKLSATRFLSATVAALSGGAVATFGFRFAYLLTAVVSVIGFAAVLGMRDVRTDGAGRRFVDVLRECVRRTRRSSALAWLALVSVAATICNHVPYELYQPFLEQGEALPSNHASLWLGLHVALVALVALPFARMSAALARGRLRLYLIVSLVISLVIVASMWLSRAPWVALLLVARSVPRALQDAPLRAEIAPRIGPQERATYFSLLSLAGRAGYALVLVAFALAGQDSDSLEATLLVATAVVAVIVALVALSATMARF